MTTANFLDPEGAAEEELFAARPSPEAENELARRYLSLAHYLASKYRRSSIDTEDLKGAASLALTKAIQRFDPEREVKFSTYASQTIVGELKRYLRDHGSSLHIPRSLSETAVAVRSASERLQHELGRSPTAIQVAETLGIELDDVVEALEYLRTSVESVDSEDATDATTIVDDLSEQAMSQSLDWTSLAEPLKSLSERDRKVVVLRYYSGLSQSQIAEEVGISQMHVSRILKNALTRLRALMGEATPA